MDDILFSRTSADCQRFCDDARAFNCRSYAQKEDRCYLSGDDSMTLPGVPQPVELEAVYKEKICTRSKTKDYIDDIDYIPESKFSKHFVSMKI